MLLYNEPVTAYIGNSIFICTISSFLTLNQQIAVMVTLSQAINKLNLFKKQQNNMLPSCSAAFLKSKQFIYTIRKNSHRCIFRSCVNLSTLNRTDGKSLQEELLSAEEYDKYRDDCHTAGCHGQVVLGYLGTYELIQRQRDSPLSPVGDKYQRVKVCIPAAQEGYGRLSRDGGLYQGKHYLKEGTVLSCAVDLRRLTELIGSA